MITGLKEVSELRVGDTLTSEARPAAEPLPGYKEVKPMVFAGLFPTDSDDYPELRDALEKLKLNDAALFYEPETSQALGFGFRCGFLGLLHMEIVRERLEREFDLDLLATAPNVAYRVRGLNGPNWIEVHTPSDLPDAFEEVEEPYIKASVHRPEGVRRHRDGALQRAPRPASTTWSTSPSSACTSTYELPLAEIVLDFYDSLKSRTRGYASFDYDIVGFRPGTLVRVDVLVGGDPVDALSLVIHRDFAYDRGRMLVEKLRQEIPRQMFDVPIQAAIGSRVIARETVKARRKDVTREVLRRRHLAQAQAPREAEGGEEADEAGRRGRGAAVGVPRRAEPRGERREEVTCSSERSQRRDRRGRARRPLRSPAVLRAPLRLLRLRHRGRPA